MNTKIEMTVDEEIATRMPSNRYFVMTPKGEFASTNDHGKGTRFAFANKKSAMLRVEWGTEGTYAFDIETRTRLK